MGFKDLVGKAQDLAGSIGDIGGRLMDEFNETLPVLRGLGFTVRELRINMGLTPEVGAKLVSSIDAFDVNTIHELIERNAGKKLLITTLKALEAAYNIKRLISDLPLDGVELDLTLGLSPHVNVGFVTSAPS